MFDPYRRLPVPIYRGSPPQSSVASSTLAPGLYRPLRIRCRRHRRPNGRRDDGIASDHPSPTTSPPRLERYAPSDPAIARLGRLCRILFLFQPAVRPFTSNIQARYMNRPFPSYQISPTLSGIRSFGKIHPQIHTALIWSSMRSEFGPAQQFSRGNTGRGGKPSFWTSHVPCQETGDCSNNAPRH